MAGEPPARIAIATHYYATGPAFALEAYLQPRVRELLFIAHPLFRGGGPSYFRRYRAAVLAETRSRAAGIGALRFFADLARTRRWVRQAGRHDLFIAGDPLLAIAGLWLRRTGWVRAVTLYAIDYTPRRFSNPMMNRSYHRIDRFVSRHVDLIWNLSPAIEAARRQRDGPARTAPQLVVPLGTEYRRIARKPLSHAAPHRIAFVGHLLEKQGLQLAIAALPIVRRRVPDISLLVIGDGPYRLTLERLAREAGVEDLVRFSGFVDDHAQIERELAVCALGLAPYVPDADSFTRFADPGKVKTYLACGLPVILTDVPAVAQLVERAGAGRVVSYDAAALADAIIEYVTDPARLQRAREAAAELGSGYAWDRVFSEAFHASAPYLG